MKMLQTNNVSKEEIDSIINKESSKSSRMKELFLLGIDIKQISILMNTRYQFVYNVCSNFVNIESLEIVQEEKHSKKSEVIALFLNNHSNIEISKLLKTNYNYVYKILKEYKLLQENESKERKESK